ncbi:MAG: hypothetical protein P0120_02875 [Nitrospira sp.]|nr:hypothetical protein [Nitrospira sp.]
MADNAVRHFLPWVRQGAAFGITTPDSLGSAQRADVSLPVSVQLTSFTVPARDVRLYGPADVTAIDPRQIVRVQPRHQTTNFESNFFPLVEFDRPDFPWLFTPAKAGAGERLRPWICLVVVRKRPSVTFGRTDTSPLSVLEFTSPVAEDLPDLEESWAWVHAQVVGSSTDTVPTLKSAIENAPTRTVSRLMCPRRLDPDVAYLACVVPVFEVGRKVALGLPVAEQELEKLEPAWRLDQPTAPFQLPVLYSWEFTTGPEGDFESLVRDLTPQPLPEEVGTRSLDLTTPGFGLPSGGVIAMKGILKPPEPVTVQPQPVPSPLQDKLAEILNAPADALNTPVAQDPIVAPPIYGSIYPPRERVEVGATPSHWINDLNLDPRDRIAASFGTRIVQEDQEHLMASAWQQVDAIEKENEERRRKQLAAATRQATWVRHVRPIEADGLLQITGSSLAKVAVSVKVGDTNVQRTVAWQMSGSEAPGFQSAALRRVARPRGPINRRALTPAVVQNQTFARPMVKLLQTLPPVNRVVMTPPPRIFVGRMATIKSVSDVANTPHIDQARLVPANFNSTVRPPVLTIRETQGEGFRAVDDGGLREPTLMAEFRQAAVAHLSKLVRIGVTGKIVFRVPDVGVLKGRLQPLQLSTGSRRRGLKDAAIPDEEQILAHPRFPAPMSERLMELAPEFLLPGLEDVPPNSVTLVQPNSRFIEAFMIGLNHEMGRELLWREYPTDRRGSYFRFFWNRRGSAQQEFMQPIHAWNGPLGRNPSASGNPDQLVLLVRGELFRRYPNAVIYAAKATGTATNPKLTTQERYPLFRGSAPPDVVFFGFDLTASVARGIDPDPGWFFVIQQQPGEPDFGLDMPKDINPQPPRVTDWNQLTWRHLVQSEAELRELIHVNVGVKPATPPPLLPDTSADPPGAQWGANGAHMARITLQKPVRIAILARHMLP